MDMFNKKPDKTLLVLSVEEVVKRLMQFNRESAPFQHIDGKPEGVDLSSFRHKRAQEPDQGGYDDVWVNGRRSCLRIIMTGKFFLFAIVLAGLSLFSCKMNGSDQPDIVDMDAIRTQAVSTFASSLTETLAPKSTASTTLTSLPTFTPSTVTLTPSPTATQNPCYNLIWLEDRSIPDGVQMKANEVFTKTWLVQNTGGCAWAPGFTFRHVGGDPMRGKTLVLDQPIPVGAKRELSIELVVPSGQTGLIQSSWRMADSQGYFFGDTLSVNITVGTITTPAVTSTP